MKKIFSILLFFNFFITSAQQGIVWQKTMGGSLQENFNSCVYDNFNGFLIGGSSSSSISGDKNDVNRGVNDVWIIKFNSNGTIEWQKTIGGNNADGLYKIINDSDGGFILGCSSSSNISGEKTEDSRGQNDYWLIKIDSQGNIIWQKTIGGEGIDVLRSITNTLDGGLLIGGTSDSIISGEKTENPRGDFFEFDYWVLKLDSDNTIEWQRTIGGDLSDRLYTVRTTTDGGYILGGESLSNISAEKTEDCRGDFDFWVVKLDIQGDIEWQKTLGGNGLEVYGDLIQTLDGGFLVGGYSYSGISGDKTEENHSDFADYWIIKLNNIGEIEWQKVIGGFESDYLETITQKSDGTIVLGGSSQSNISGDKTENSRGSSDFWLVLIDENGEILGQKTIGGLAADGVKDVVFTPNGNYFVGGNSLSDISGEKTETNRGGSDYWIMLLEPDVLSIEDQLFSNLKIFPNPTIQFVTISFQKPFNGKIIQTDVSGKQIQIQPIKDKESLSLEIIGAEGVYFLTFEDEKGVNQTLKVIKKL